MASTRFGGRCAAPVSVVPPCQRMHNCRSFGSGALTMVMSLISKRSMRLRSRRAVVEGFHSRGKSVADCPLVLRSGGAECPTLEVAQLGLQFEHPPHRVVPALLERAGIRRLAGST